METVGAVVTIGEIAAVKIASKAPSLAARMRAFLEDEGGYFPLGKIDGEWIVVFEKMSQRSKDYQRFITGTDEVFLRNGVKFDGITSDTLIEVKGYYKQFVDKKTGRFYSWFQGERGLVAQAERQLAAANGLPIKWYFAEQESLDATRALFNRETITGIELIYKTIE